MCFSAEASFAGGVIISAIGIAVIKKVHKPSQLLFACVPLFFGIQQFAEGTLWLTIPYAEYDSIRKTATYIFLIMADVLWPVWIPLSVLFMEDDARRKKIMHLLFIIGLIVSLHYTWCLLFFTVKPQIMGYHIKYNSTFPILASLPAFILYLLATITPLFAASIKRLHFFGILMVFSCLVTAVYYTQFLTSVWCFFAALISGVIYWILNDSKRKFLFKKMNFMQNQPHLTTELNKDS